MDFVIKVCNSSSPQEIYSWTPVIWKVSNRHICQLYLNLKKEIGIYKDTCHCVISMCPVLEKMLQTITVIGASFCIIIIINLSFYPLLIEANILQSSALSCLWALLFSMLTSRSPSCVSHNIFSIPFIKKLIFSQITYKPGNSIVAETVFKF